MNQLQEGVMNAFNIIYKAHEAKIAQKQHEDEVQLRRDQLDQQQAQFDAQQKANEKMFDLQHSIFEHQQAQQELADTREFQKTGITNASVLPSLGQTAQVQPTNVQLSPYNPASPMVQPQTMTEQPQAPTGQLVGQGLQNNQLVYPSGNTYSVPLYAQSPEQQLIKQQSAEAEARKQRETLTTQQAETERQLAVGRQLQEEETKRYLAQINLQKTYDADKDKRDIEGRLAIARMETAERLRAAAIQATGGLSEMGNLFGTAKGTEQVTPNAGTGAPQINIPGPLGASINQSLTNIYKGTDSLERQEKVNPKIKQMISSAAAMSNVGSLTDSDVKELHDLQLMSAAAPILKQMHDLKASNPYQISIPGTDAFSKFNTLQGQMDTLIPRIATSSSGSKRMSEPELKRYFDGYTPSRMPTQKAVDEHQKYNKFVVQDLWNRAKDIVQGLPPDQQNAVLSQYNFTKLPSTYVTPKRTVNTQRDPVTGKIVEAIQ